MKRTARERLLEHAAERGDESVRLTKRLLAAYKREVLAEAAERGVAAARKHSAGARSTSSDFEYAIRAAITERK